MGYKLIAGGLSILITGVASGNEIDHLVQQSLRETFASDALLHDRETLTIGILTFNPNHFLPIDDEDIGSDESERLKNELQTFTLPYTYEFLPGDQVRQRYVTGRLGLTQREQDVSFPEELDPTQDFSRNRVYSAYLAYGIRQPITDEWRWEAELGGMWQRFENEYTYNNRFTSELQPEIDGIINNFSVNAWQINPSLAATWIRVRNKHQFRFRSRLNYQRGQTYGTDQAAHQTKIQSYTLRNSFDYKYLFGRWLSTDFTGQLGVSRVDLWDDVASAVEADHYHEYKGQLLFGTTEYGYGWVDNLALGVLLNYGGSLLKGANITVGYNVEW